MNTFSELPEETKKEIRELVDENRRLRTIIRKMAEKGAFAPLALVEFEMFGGDTPQILICTADRDETALGNAIVNAWCEAFGWKSRGPARTVGVGNDGDDPNG